AQDEGLVVLDLGGAVGDRRLALRDDLGELLVAVVPDGFGHRATLYHPAPRSWSALDHSSMAAKVAAGLLQNSHRRFTGLVLHPRRAALRLSCGAMIDSHCHLTRLPDPDVAVATSGLAWIVTVGTSLEDSRAALALARRHPRVRVAVGVHPNEASA